MEKLVEELKQVMPFKDTTEVDDIVLVVAQEPQMLLYGLVTSIERDTKKRDEWWHISLTFLTVPLQKVVWTLRTEQMTGQEIFTMGGEERFFKAVELSGERAGASSLVEHEEDAQDKKPELRRIK